MPKKLTKDEFILKAKSVHGDKYDYSKVEYVNSHTKVCIVCPTHGEFWQIPNSHILGHGCPKCKAEKISSMNTKTTEQFISEARKVHGDKYDYSKVEYVNSLTKVCIICPTHGEFLQTPAMHLSGQGCVKCSIERNAKRNKLTKDEFILKAKSVHGDKYDYSKVEYVNSLTKVCIVCPTHGEFWQTPNSHMLGHGCPKCRAEKISLMYTKTTEQFISEARKVHGDKYDYSKVEYKGICSKVCIICPKHGEFLQNPNDHLNGHGCPKCNCLYKTNEQFIEEARKVHNNFYSYEKTKYVNKLTKVIITCPIHGDFEQLAQNHLKGCHCPKCSTSKLESSVMRILNENNISYTFQKRFSWLENQRLDFYLPKYNIAIECQGRQHFKAIGHFGGEKGFKDSMHRDNRKKSLCEANGLRLLYYTDLDEYDSFLGDRILKTESQLMSEIFCGNA